MAIFSVLLALAGLAAAQINGKLTLAKSYTSWDCCKPVCATSNNRNDLVASRGVAKVCDRSNNALGSTPGIRATSGCQNGGTGFLCANYQPVPVAEDLSYGFAIKVGGQPQGDNANCCRCYEVEWVSGAAKDKKMVVQVINIASGTQGTDNSVRENDIIILTPGGGVGPYNTGCTTQYGTQFAQSWGPQYGGYTNATGCANLPQNLQGGCYWRFNWARGSMNGWDIVHQQVQCPSRLTDISGCHA